jgi:hypothetical protein
MELCTFWWWIRVALAALATRHILEWLAGQRHETPVADTLEIVEDLAEEV